MRTFRVWGNVPLTCVIYRDGEQDFLSPRPFLILGQGIIYFAYLFCEDNHTSYDNNQISLTCRPIFYKRSPHYTHVGECSRIFTFSVSNIDPLIEGVCQSTFTNGEGNPLSSRLSRHPAHQATKR